MKRALVIAAAALIGLAGIVTAQTISVPQVTSIGPTDLFQDVVRGQPSAQSQYASAALLGNYSSTLGGNNPENALIGGDSTTNLWQRATTGTSVTTVTTYGGPDRWAYWSGTSTAMTVSRTTTAGDLPGALTYKSGFKMARTSGETGVVEVCMLQALETANSLQFSGQTAEIDFHATAGATFTGASSAMKVYLVTGTGTDESAAKAAYSVNAGGGGTPGWTGGVATGVSVTISATNQRYTVAIPVPAATTQVAVALCWTPVGTAGANDYIAFSGIQLTRNSALTSAAGTAGVALPVNDTRAKSFSRRTQALETSLQQRYFYKVTETATVAVRGSCVNLTSSISNCVVPFPVLMRIVPTMTYATGFAIAVAAQTSVASCSANATSTTASSTPSPLSVLMSCATTTSGGALGTATTWGDNSGSGTISASAEL